MQGAVQRATELMRLPMMASGSAFVAAAQRLAASQRVLCNLRVSAADKNEKNSQIEFLNMRSRIYNFILQYILSYIFHSVYV